MIALSRTTQLRVTRLKYANAPGHEYTYYWTIAGLGEDRYSAREVAPSFSLKPSTMENAIARHWKVLEQARGESILTVDITDWIKREARAARAKALLPKRPKRRNRTTAERKADTRKANQRKLRRHIVALRAAGIAPNPFASDAPEGADQTRSQRDPVFDDGHNGVP